MENIINGDKCFPGELGRSGIDSNNLEQILDIMPETVRLFPNGCEFRLVLSKKGGLWFCNYESSIGTKIGTCVEYYDSPTKAVLSRLEYLFENNLLEEYESKN